jgi:uncharacterized protein YecT (DUF1311 family)
MRRPILAALLVLALSPLCATAQTQAEMNQTSASEAEAADKELNAVYKKVLATLDEEGVALLKKSQRAWLAYRDAEAAFSADLFRGGSLAPMQYSETLAALTRERSERLKECLDQ